MLNKLHLQSDSLRLRCETHQNFAAYMNAYMYAYMLVAHVHTVTHSALLTADCVEHVMGYAGEGLSIWSAQDDECCTPVRSHRQ